MSRQWYPPHDRPTCSALGSPFLPTAGACFMSTVVPSNLRIPIFLPAILLLLSRTRTCSTGAPEQDYMTGINTAVFVCKFVDFAILQTPEREYHRIDLTNQDKPVVNENPTAMSIWQRVKWNVSLWTTYRGIGWDWEVKNVERVPKNVTKV